MVTHHRYAEVAGRRIFYREAGSPAAPAVVLLHGTPSSSHQYRNLIPALADRYHVIAPDYPGFGHSDVPGVDEFKYTFDNVDFDFLPAAWLVKVDSVRASMTMSQPFQEVWLPKDIDIQAAVTTAIGQFSFRQAVNYHDYREANVTSKVFIPGSSKKR